MDKRGRATTTTSLEDLLPRFYLVSVAIMHLTGLTETRNNPNVLVDIFEKKYLDQYTFHLRSNLSTLRRFVTTDGSSSRRAGEETTTSIMTWDGIDNGDLWDADVGSDNLTSEEILWAARNEPSITLSIPSNRSDFWAAFSRVLQDLQAPKMSQKIYTEARPISMIVWPETAVQESELKLVENEIKSNPILEAYKQVLEMDKHVFIILPVNLAGLQNNYVYELYFIKDIKVFERVEVDLKMDLLRFKSRRCNLRSVPINSIVQYDPRLAVNDFFTIINGTAILDDGISFNFFNFLSAKFNFTNTFIPGKGWIRQNQTDGSLTGMGAQLLKHEGDIVASISELKEYRQEQLAMSLSMHHSKVEVYFKQSTATVGKDIYLSTFRKELWLVIFCMWFIICLVFVLIYKRRSLAGVVGDEEIISESIILWTVANASQQGWTSTPSSIPLRIVCLCALVAGLVIYTVFSSQIISKLSVRNGIFSSVDDLLDAGFTLYSTEGAVNAKALLEVKLAARNIDASQYIIDTLDGFAIINSSKSAFLHLNNLWYGLGARTNYTEEQLCSFQSKIKIDNSKVSSVMYFRKDDPIRKFFFYELSKWMERGLLFRMQLEFDRKILPVCGEEVQEMNHICLIDVTTAFFIFGTGAVISLLLLSVENFVFRYRSSFRRE